MLDRAWSFLCSGSVALAGFGIDSVIEIFASMVVVWQLKAINTEKEHLAERLIGLAFLLLAAYIAVQSGIVLLIHFHPRTSSVGIVWLALTFGDDAACLWEGQDGTGAGQPGPTKGIEGDRG
jgi:hypothetical protein